MGQASCGTTNCYRIYNHVSLILKQVQNDRLSSHPGLVLGTNIKEMLKQVQHDYTYWTTLIVLKYKRLI